MKKHLLTVLILPGLTVSSFSKPPIVKTTTDKIELVITSRSSKQEIDRIKSDLAENKVIFHLSKLAYNAIETISVIEGYVKYKDCNLRFTQEKAFDKIIITVQKNDCSIHLHVAKLSAKLASPVQRSFSVQQVNADFEIFRTTLERTHPGLYTFHSKLEMNKLFEQVNNKLYEGITEIEYYELLLPVIAKIGCGHTGLNVSETFFDNNALDFVFPFQVKIINNRLFTGDNYSGEPLFNPGNEIVSIDGVGSGKIISILAPLISADGYIVTGKYRKLERRFSFHYSSLFNASKNHLLEIKPYASENLIQKNVQMMHQDSLDNIIPGVTKLDLKIVNINTALMSIKSFGDDAVDKDGNNFEKFLATSFKNINSRGVKNLIIDLRGNGGGFDEYGAHLFSYITDKPFRCFKFIQANSDKVDLQYTDRKEVFNQRINERLFLADDGRYLVKDSAHDGLRFQSPQPNPFMGNLYILINGRSFSTTADFAAYVKNRNRAIFIGEETGGTMEGNNSMFTYVLTLPQTGIRVQIPVFKYVSDVNITVKDKGRGVIPDIIVDPSQKGLSTGVDEVLEQTFQIINRKK